MDNWMKGAFSIMVLCILFAVVYSMAACGSTPQIPLSKFHAGQSVTITQTGEKTLVVEAYRWCSEWRYECRVASPIQQHRDGAFTRDTEITRYALVVFREFELKE